MAASENKSALLSASFYQPAFYLPDFAPLGDSVPFLALALFVSNQTYRPFAGSQDLSFSRLLLPVFKLRQRRFRPDGLFL